MLAPSVRPLMASRHQPQASAPAAGAAPAPPAGGVVLNSAQATAIREIVKAMFELCDDEILHKGEKTDILTMIGSRMSAESRAVLRTLDLR